MKKINILGLLVLIGLFVGCSSEQESVKSNSQAVQPKPVYFTGNGGEGFTLAVLEPTGSALTDAERYLLPLVQGSITGDFNKYSAITIIDRQNLDKILAEQSQSLSGDYSDEDYISIGHLTNARYILTGSITKTASNYVLELSISDAQSGERKASYPPKPVSHLALENLSAVKEASADLLAQLGVQLTDTGKQELSAVVNTASVNAETALSRAIVAQRNGTVVEALSYYYQAASYDPSQSEAAVRLSTLSTEVKSGNIGQNVRNEIQWRNEWKKVLDEANAYFKAHPPFEVVYEPSLTQGKIDYEKETVSLSFMLALCPTDGFKVISTILDGLNATGKKEEWKFKEWPMDYIFNSTNSRFTIAASLVNETEKILATGSISLSCFARGTSAESIKVWFTFSGVNANDISDMLTVKITSVNNISAEEAGKQGYIKISADSVLFKYEVHNGTITITGLR